LAVALLAVIIRNSRRRNRDLAETNATKDKFFSIISHDLKNPAITQRDSIQILLENISLWNELTMTKYCRELLFSADHQVDLLYNLLNWAQVQTGRMPYSPGYFDLATRLRTDLALLQYIANQKNIRLNVAMPERAPVTGDADMLTTVIRNLLTNAVKFTPKGGTVTLTISGGNGSAYTVSISDTGIGMTPEQINKLYSIVSRKETVGKSSSGLGLIVCKEFVEKHGSKLEVESEVGKGSRFWFEV
jgi:signal transduction histidine kinase